MTVLRVRWERIARSAHLVQDLSYTDEEEIDAELWLFAQGHLKSSTFDIVRDGMTSVRIVKPKSGGDPVEFGRGTIEVVG